MSYPVDVLAYNDLRDTLRGVRVAAGFENNFSVLEEQADPVSPRHGTVVLKIGDTEEVENAALGHDEHLLPIGIICYAIQSTRVNSPPIRLALQSMIGDVKKALAVDLNRSDTALNTTISDSDITFFTDGSPASVLIVAKIHIRTLWDQPDEQ
jgi:hypothetical protein